MLPLPRPLMRVCSLLQSHSKNTTPRKQTIMTDAVCFSQANKRAFRNPCVIGWLTLLTVVLAVNITMIVLAFTTGPGLVEKDYYEKGRDLEKNIHKQIAARNALGWTSNLDVPDT